jgi:Dipeptidyl peptidase IV (DPP IV) N-terminal region
MHRWLFLVAFLFTVTPLAAQTRPLTLDHLYDPQRRIDFSGGAPSGMTWLSDTHDAWPRPTKDGVDSAAFVRRNNLHVVNLDEQRQEKQLTTDGTDQILNGKLDWVYQEEVYGRGDFKAYCPAVHLWWPGGLVSARCVGRHDGNVLAPARAERYRRLAL